MGCGCVKKVNRPEKNRLADDLDKEKIKPFDTCALCAVKHLSYALILLNDYEQTRAVAQIYLAYKHLEKVFEKEATICFQFIEDYFNSHIELDKLCSFIKEVQKLTESNKEIEEKKPLRLENKLNEHFKSSLYILAAGELFNYEFGYRDVNTPYVIGFLQKAIENINDEYINSRIRVIWKKIESRQIIKYMEFTDVVSLLSIQHLKNKQN